MAPISFNAVTGRVVAAQAAQRLARVQLEMGGKNPLIVLADAELDRAIDHPVNGAFFATGQRCTASGRLIVAEPVHDRFVAGVIERLKALPVDHALKPATKIGPVVDQSQLDQDAAYIELGRREGARLAYGGERLNRETKGFYLSPALFADTASAMRINREEVFGPAASMIRVKDYDEALHVANDTPYGLVAGICIGSLKHASHFKRNA